MGQQCYVDFQNIFNLQKMRTDVSKKKKVEANTFGCLPEETFIKQKHTYIHLNIKYDIIS